MFAILISPENREKIERDETFDPELVDLDISLKSNFLWVYVRGYVDPRGRLIEWTLLPWYMMVKNFEFDEDKIKTDWDQIVRKERP